MWICASYLARADLSGSPNHNGNQSKRIWFYFRILFSILLRIVIPASRPLSKDDYVKIEGKKLFPTSGYVGERNGKKWIGIALKLCSSEKIGNYAEKSEGILSHERKVAKHPPTHHHKHLLTKSLQMMESWFCFKVAVLLINSAFQAFHEQDRN